MRRHTQPHARLLAVAIVLASCARPTSDPAPVAPPVVITPATPVPGDRDGDGIPDALDACPLEAGPASAVPTKNGCPTTTVGGPCRVRFELALELDRDAATVTAAMADELQKLVDYIGACQRGGATTLTVEGNASPDETDPDALARKRAEACKAWLVVHGVEADRIRVAAFGATRPVADPSTAEGRAHDRRVGFSFSSAR